MCREIREQRSGVKGQGLGTRGQGPGRWARGLEKGTRRGPAPDPAPAKKTNNKSTHTTTKMAIHMPIASKSTLTVFSWFPSSQNFLVVQAPRFCSRTFPVCPPKVRPPGSHPEHASLRFPNVGPHTPGLAPPLNFFLRGSGPSGPDPALCLVNATTESD